MSPYKFLYDIATKLKQGDKSSFELPPSCYNCTKRKGKPSQLCSGCHAVYYCDRACQRENWKDRDVPGGFQVGHKHQCARMKEQLKMTPEFDAIRLQFPWGRIGMNGRWSLNVFLAMRNLLGDDRQRFGWWASVPEHVTGTPRGRYGFTLASSKHLAETTGWRLPVDQTPFLDFGNPGAKRPLQFPPKFDDNWTSYYAWRCLPIDSPAALLLHWPLSIYMLLRLLNLVPSTGKVPESRQKITIHYIGAETELDFLPVFGELALLTPNTDLDMIIFSSHADSILSKHKKSQSVIAQPTVYSYQAPEDLGSGAIHVSVAKTGPSWKPSVLKTYEKPNALIGLNAGVSSYEEWRDVFAASRAWDIPFAVTDYGQQSFEDDALMFNQIMSFFPLDPSKQSAFGVDGMAKLVKSRNIVVSNAINPFQMPGEKWPGMHRLPMAVNGLTSIITAKEA